MHEQDLLKQEKIAGIQASDRLLAPFYRSEDTYSTDHPDGTYTVKGQFIDFADRAQDAGDFAQESLLRTVALAPEFVECQVGLNKARADARREKRVRDRVLPATRSRISSLRERVFDFNASLKQYRDTHPEDSMTRTVAMLTRSYRTMMVKEGHPTVPTPDVESSFIEVARGMRAELAVEEILGTFEDVEIHYAYNDDETARRKLETEGTDYVIDVTVLGRTFPLHIDVKAGESATRDDQDEPIVGKLWSQCVDSDFSGGGTRPDPRRIGHKSLPMQDALILQIQLQYPGELEMMCDARGETLDDIDIN
jgi:hypothetical protein